MVKQELQCTECGQYVQFNLDFDIDGNHTIKCPICGHDHYRVVKDGKITDIRWASSGAMINCTIYSSSASSMLNTMGAYSNWYATSSTTSASTNMYNVFRNYGT